MSTVYIEKSDIASTLTTWVYCSMWQLWTAEQMGMNGYINWPRHRNRWLVPYWDDAAFDRNPNAYEWYFQQPKFPGMPSPPPSRDLTWEWEHCPESGVHPFMSQPLPVIRDYYQKHLKFSPEVEARGNALVTKYSLDFPNLIAISWRGTDCTLDGRPRMPIEYYFHFIDEILAQRPDMRILATAEEEKILDPLLARYPSAFTISEWYTSPHGCPHNPERISPFSGYERGMQPAVMVWVLSKCAHYIKNRSSMASVACWLSSGRIVSLAHGENLGYDKFDLGEAEIKGQRVKIPGA